MHHVFLSYSRKNSDIVLPLADELDRRGVPVWIDRASIPEAMPWRDEISAAIRGADLVVCLNTPSWAASAVCAEEHAEAETAGKRILTMDPAGRTVDDLASTITKTLAATPDVYRLSTIAMTRAHAWSDGGRKRYLLPRATAIRQQKRAVRATGADRDPLLRAYFTAVRRRAAFRATGSIVAFLSALVIYTAYQVLQKVNEQVDARISENDTSISAEANIEQLQHMQPQAVLAQLEADKSRGTLESTRLQYLSGLFWPTDVTNDAGIPVSTSVTSGTRTARTTKDGGYSVIDAHGAVVREGLTGSGVTALAWSPDGRLLAIADRSGVEIVAPDTGIIVQSLNGTGDGGRAVEWDDRGMLRATEGRRTVTWDLSSLIRPAFAVDAWVIAGVPSSGGRLMVALRDGGLALVAADGRQAASSPMDGAVYSPLKAISDGAVLGISRSDRGLEAQVIDSTLTATKRVPIPPGCGADDVAVTPTRFIITCGTPTLVVIDRSTMVAKTVSVGADGVAAVAVGERVFVRNRLGLVVDLGVDLGGHSVFRAITCPDAGGSLAYLSSGHQILSAGGGTAGLCSTVVSRVDDGSIGYIAFPFVAATRSQALAVSPDGHHAAFGFDDGSIWVVGSNGAIAKTTQYIAGFGTQVRALRFSDDSTSLTAIAVDGRVLTHKLDDNAAAQASAISERLRALGLTG